MVIRFGLILMLVGVLSYSASDSSQACCPAPPQGKPVVNADQTVIILWDAANKMQHFIRQASFKSDADDFGFLVPSPTEPTLEESGNEAFPYLLKLTEPEIKKVARGGGGGCACAMVPMARMDTGKAEPQVTVLQDKLVAGFHAKVLEAKSATALVGWLKDNGYAFSPEIEAWAKPYVDGGWKITALKVVKGKGAEANKGVTAAALRISFKTDRPVFPYREPDYKSAADALGAKQRMLRIYFLADARYDGELTKETPWSGKVAWAGKLAGDQRKMILEQLKLPENTGPAEWWLTEFEDNWPYKVAPADVYFSKAGSQDVLKREPVVQYVSSNLPADGAIYALGTVAIVLPIWRRLRRRPKA